VPIFNQPIHALTWLKNVDARSTTVVIIATYLILTTTTYAKKWARTTISIRRNFFWRENWASLILTYETNKLITVKYTSKIINFSSKK